MTITVVFNPPTTADSPSEFDAKAFATLADLNNWSTQANALADDVSADEAALAAAVSSAATSAALATTNGAAQVALATTQADTATTQAGIATTQASLATTNGAAQVALAATQVGIATTKAGEAATSASSAATSASTATTQAGIATAAAASISGGPVTSVNGQTGVVVIAVGSGTVTDVSGTAPITSSGGATPAIGISAATTSAAGSMSAADKTKLDGIAASANNYTHPASHLPSIITQDASNRFVTDTEKSTWNAKQALLVSGTSIKSVNGTSLLASGDLEVGYRNIPQNSQSAAYTCVLADAGKHILHPSADTTARTFTIPANSSVAYPIGTAITFINQVTAGVMTIACNDTMRLAGAGTTGSRTLAANGVATAIKITSTEWIVSGSGLT